MNPKKITVINGSYRKGNTYELTNWFISELKMLGNYEIEMIHLKDYQLNYCRSCHQCFLNDESVCPDYHPLKALSEKIEASDGIIMTSPVYALQVSALLKNFIDHKAMYFHRPRFQGKTAIVITTTAGNGAKTTAKYLANVLNYWGFKKVLRLPYTIFGRKMKEDKRLSKTIQKNAAYYHQAMENEIYQPTFKQIFNFQLWKRVTYIQGKEAFDYKYWDGKSYYDGRLYFNHHVAFYKKWFALLFSFIFSKAMKE
jgi:multimeric flavodoxin WrbA